MEEIEAMLDNHSIHNNGIRRCFSTPQKMRSAFRDLKVEAYSMTDEGMLLDKVLMKYKRSWEFFKTHLARRSNPLNTALEMLQYVFYPDSRDAYSNRKSIIFDQIIEEDISVSFLSLMLLRVIPGYDSKDGDVMDPARQFEAAMSLLEQFTEGRTIYKVFPAITTARNEPNKTRLMAYYHFSNILTLFESYLSSENMYKISNAMKRLQVEIDIKGYWNECGGEAVFTEFWKMVPTINPSVFFATHWHKDANNVLTGIRYTLRLSEADDGDVIAYIAHPQSVRNRMKGNSYTDTDHVWYQFAYPEDPAPNHLQLRRRMNSSAWPSSIELTRVNDEKVTQQYEAWMKNCTIVKPF